MDRFMERALRLAKKADPYPNPRVGAVLVKDGKVIGEGFHREAGMPHAEIEAIRSAKGDVEGAILYVTLEPCSHKSKRTPPCTDAIISSGIAKVVYAMADPNPLVSGAKALKARGIAVEGPTDERKARAINKRYMRNMMKKPFVAIKMAMTADGKTATRTGDSRWITGKEARMHVLRLRGEYDAVMVGSGTVKKDDPRLTSRTKGIEDPYRVIVDSDLCIPMGSRAMANKDGKTIVATTERAPKNKLSGLKNAIICGEEQVDMRILIQALGAMGIRKVLIEGGSELNAAALGAGIVDKLYLFVAPKMIGGRQAKGVVGGEGIASMSGCIRLRNMKCRKIGEDLLLEYDIIPRKAF